jgi:hypothetical protein
VKVIPHIIFIWVEWYFRIETSINRVKVNYICLYPRSMKYFFISFYLLHCHVEFIRSKQANRQDHLKIKIKDRVIWFFCLFCFVLVLNLRIKKVIFLSQRWHLVGRLINVTLTHPYIMSTFTVNSCIVFVNHALLFCYLKSTSNQGFTMSSRLLWFKLG